MDFLSNQLALRRAREAQRRRDEGYAASRLLRYPLTAPSVLEQEASNPFDANDFGQGMLQALRDFNNLPSRS